jgi:hypothetical protein
MGILLFILGALLGAIGTYWYATTTINDLTEKNLDKALVISLLKTRANVSTKKIVNKKERKKTKATKQEVAYRINQGHM